MKRILAVDCDLTVCPSDSGWFNWLVAKDQDKGLAVCHKIMKIEGDNVPYNLGRLFTHVDDPLDYWRTLDYDQFQPLNGAIEKLESLSKYFDIVFVSAIKGTHSKNKYYWLKKHFPFMAGYVATKEKWVMNQDKTVALIDDRLDNLEGFDHSKRVLFHTEYQQSSNCGVAYLIDDWESFSMKDFCDQYLN